MPIYEYQCQSCSLVLEKLQKISDQPLLDCPECKKPELKKQVTAGAFRLSGSGWYETDFKTGNKKNLAAGAGDGSASGSTPVESKKSGDKGGKAATAKAE